MYNLTVDEAHTFFVGDGQWLVHNQDAPPTPPTLLPINELSDPEIVLNWSISNLVDNPIETNDLVLGMYKPHQLLEAPNPAQYTYYVPGFSGAYDFSTGKFVAVPIEGSERATSNLPFKTVWKSMGHRTVAKWLSERLNGAQIKGRMGGFTLGFAQVAGGKPQIFTRWNSNSLNVHFHNIKGEGNKKLPIELQQKISATLKKALSCGVSNG